MFEIDKNGKTLLIEQICDRIMEHIESGQWVAGYKLPSVRVLAKQLEVSTYTISNVYDVLVDRDIIQSRKGVGYFVQPRKAFNSEPDTPRQPSSNYASFVMDVLDQEKFEVPVSSGFLPTSWLEDAIPASVTGRLMRTALANSIPAPAAGSKKAREIITQKLSQLQLSAPAEQVVVTVGATQAFKLIQKAVLKRGDKILVEDPSYLLLHLKLAADPDFPIITVPRLEDGPDIEALEAILKKHRPKLFYTQTLMHNPTGGNTSPANCYRILSLAEKYDLHIVEDDIFGFLCKENPLRLASLNNFHRVFYVGSFGKLLSPALRLGYVIPPKQWVQPLIEQKTREVLSGSYVDETIVTYALESGRFKRHMENLRIRTLKERADARKWMEECGITFDDHCFDGFFLWGKLPERMDAGQFVKKARDKRILLVQGSLFSNTEDYSQYIRLNVAYSNNYAFKKFVQSAMK